MFQSDIEKVVKIGVKKVTFLEKDFKGYFVTAILAGAFVALAIVAAFGLAQFVTTIIPEAWFANHHDWKVFSYGIAKIIASMMFVLALGLVMFAGSELFTGGNMVMAIGMLEKKISVKQSAKLWATCWIGNLVGSLIVVAIFVYVKTFDSMGFDFIDYAVNAKVSYPVGILFVRAIICNIFVCMGVWLSYRMKSESAVLIMMFLCIFTFVFLGGEHSVANMSLLPLALIHGGETSVVTISNILLNLSVVTIGNIVGGALFIGLPYWYASRKKDIFNHLNA